MWHGFFSRWSKYYFKIFDQTQVKANFTGQSIKGIPEGKSKLRLEKHPS